MIRKELLNLPIEDKCQITYVWLDGDYKLRAKSRTLKDGDIIPEWSYNGYMTNQIDEIKLIPKSIYRDPFRAGGIITLCETYNIDDTPQFNNNRCDAVENFEKKKNHEIYIGIEQRFKFDDENDSKLDESEYYCNTGYNKICNRDIMEIFYRSSLFAGIKIGGMNTSNEYGKWEYQIGICNGVEVVDNLLLSRYILERVAEMYKVTIKYKNIDLNYSTIEMRNDNGLEKILNTIEKLDENHDLMQVYYGVDFEFSWGYDFDNKVRINNKTKVDNKGYFEIREIKPEDEYLLISKILDITT